LLEELQNDAVPLADLQQHYLRGQIYLERCEGLLLKAEQNVVQLNPDTLEPLDDA
jgi:exodeoxyribonuclease VII small subunit